MRLILFLLKCLVGLLASIGFLVAAGLTVVILLVMNYGELRKDTVECGHRRGRCAARLTISE